MGDGVRSRGGFYPVFVLLTGLDSMATLGWQETSDEWAGLYPSVVLKEVRVRKPTERREPAGLFPRLVIIETGTRGSATDYINRAGFKDGSFLKAVFL